MTGIMLSKTLLKSLPADEQSNADERLWIKSGGKCFLCGDHMNRAAEVLEIDHDIPSSAGGKDEIANLNVVHRHCNRFKKNHPSVNVRPFLKFQAFVRGKGDNLKYDGCVEYFGVAVKPVVVSERANGVVRFELPDNSTRDVPTYTESRAGRTFRYCFVDLPMSAIGNDDLCQPRTVKLPHVWSILSDLQFNPLHEPPACRFEGPADGSPRQLLMFDGQHKTLSVWLSGENRVVTKVYLDMTAASAITLVNSIQSKIKKLPLSPFELSAKLSDEWAGKLAAYESAVDPNDISEKGFLDWFSDPVEKRRAKEAWIAALIQRVLSDPTLDLANYVKRAGGPAPQGPSITETSAKKKVLEQLLHLSPLSEKGEQMHDMRERELSSIVRLLNQFTQTAFELGASSSPQAQERMKRMMFQSSLQYIAGLLRQLFANIMAEKPEAAFLKGEPTPQRWELIEAGIKRIIEHPIWTADWNHSDKTKAVYEALQKNQNAEDAFEAVGLRLGYVVGADALKATALG